MPDMSIADAARALGYSVDTVRRGVVKGVGPLADLLRDAGRRQQDGQWLVTLTAQQIEGNRKRIGQHEPASNAVAQAGIDDALVTELRARIADKERTIEELKAERNRLEEKLARVENDAKNERERLEAEARAAGAETAAARQETTEERRRADMLANKLTDAINEKVELERRHGVEKTELVKNHAVEKARLEVDLAQARRRWWHRLVGR
jgi:chromosome segregation ATPase